MMKKLLRLLLVFSLFHAPLAAEDNPSYDLSWFWDICWSCTLPIHVAGFSYPENKDFVEYKHKTLKDRFCSCNYKKFLGLKFPTVWGVRIAMWEPQAIVEVTHTPYKLPIIGDYTAAKSTDFKHRGSISNSDAGRSSFYNVHYYLFPFYRAAAILPGFTCIRNIEFSMPWFMSELWPFWNDSGSLWHWVVAPERYTYAHPYLQEACKKDCEASMKRKPTDQYHWCAGCLGSLYPFCGHVGYHIGGIQATSLLVTRTIGLFHSIGRYAEWAHLNQFGLGKGYETDNFCYKTHSTTLRKTIYKTQLLRPKPDRGYERNGVKETCHPLGDSDRDWGKEMITPTQEDCLYIVWTKLHCCYDFIDVFKKSIASVVAIFEAIPADNQKEKEKKKEEMDKMIKDLNGFENKLEEYKKNDVHFPKIPEWEHPKAPEWEKEAA